MWAVHPMITEDSQQLLYVHTVGTLQAYTVGLVDLPRVASNVPQGGMFWGEPCHV